MTTQAAAAEVSASITPGRSLPWKALAAGRALLLASSAALGVAVLYLVAVRTGTGQRFDDAVVIGRVEQQSWFRWAVVVRLTRWSDIPLMIGAAVAFGWAVATRRIAQAVGALAIIGGSFVTTEVLKKGLLSRPPMTDTYPFNSYPSGHTTVAVAVAVGLVLVAPQAWRGRVAMVVGLLATLVANGTLAIGWHRASDAIGACLVVLAWAGAVVAVMLAFGTATRATPGRARRLSHGAWGLAALTVACGLPALWQLGGVLRRLRNPAVLSTSELRHLYNTADLLVLASVTATMALFLLVLQGISLDSARAGRGASGERPIDG
ncbi:MAG: phosphatase PAP2 family protein [Microthrixaceae bacterium]